MNFRLPQPVVQPGEFLFSVAGLAHGHIYSMTRALVEAGATLYAVWDQDSGQTAKFLRAFPGTRVASGLDELLAEKRVRLVAGAAVPSDRFAIGQKVMEAGKDYFVDKPPLTTLEQLDCVRRTIRQTGQKYMVYYSERLHSEAATFAEHLIRQGRIGRVIHLDGFGPHRLNEASRPDWFFQKKRYGGILCDIGSHQLEQFLHFTGARSAVITGARTANYAHPTHPELEDFGDCTVTADNGATGYFRVDWFTPAGLSSWGDGRTFILGTEGYIELRKYADIASDHPGEDHVYWVDRTGEHRFDATGRVGCPFFGQLIRDCLDRTEMAMTQDHALLAAELCLKAQLMADQSKP